MKAAMPTTINFWKYHGAGNDFIMIDNRLPVADFTPSLVNFLCDRHLGIGADGLICIEEVQDADFEMKYYNSDGYEGSMCGNGGRSAAAFASELGIVQSHCRFAAFDGLHEAWIERKSPGQFHVRLSMADVQQYQAFGNDLIINTGSPHYIKKVDNLDFADVLAEGRKIRYDKQISEEGVNVNFLQIEGNRLSVRTYERGVEAETLSCGTGVTACAIANCIWNGQLNSEIHTKGGTLRVELRKEGSRFTDIFLEGPVSKVFSGTIEIQAQ